MTHKVADTGKTVTVSTDAWRALKRWALNGDCTIREALDQVLALTHVPASHLAAAGAVVGTARPVEPIAPPRYLCGHCPGEHPIGSPCAVYPDRPAKTRLVRVPATGEWDLDPASGLSTELGGVGPGAYAGIRRVADGVRARLVPGEPTPEGWARVAEPPLPPEWWAVGRWPDVIAGFTGVDWGAGGDHTAAVDPHGAVRRTPPTPHPSATAAALQQEGTDRQRAADPHAWRPADPPAVGVTRTLAPGERVIGPGTTTNRPARPKAPARPATKSAAEALRASIPGLTTAAALVPPQETPDDPTDDI